MFSHGKLAVFAFKLEFLMLNFYKFLHENCTKPDKFSPINLTLSLTSLMFFAILGVMCNIHVPSNLSNTGFNPHLGFCGHRAHDIFSILMEAINKAGTLVSNRIREECVKTLQLLVPPQNFPRPRHKL